MTTAPATRPRLRLSLRTLLVLVAVAPLPVWVVYQLFLRPRDRIHYVSARIKVNCPPDVVIQRLERAGIDKHSNDTWLTRSLVRVDPVPHVEEPQGWVNFWRQTKPQKGYANDLSKVRAAANEFLMANPDLTPSWYSLKVTSWLPASSHYRIIFDEKVVVPR